MLFPRKEKRKKENLSARFSLCTPRGLTLEEKQHVQEVRWDIRKAFSGSIRQAGKRGEGRQTDRQTDRVGDGERDTQSPGEREVLGEQPVLFKSTVTHLSRSW